MDASEEYDLISVSAAGRILGEQLGPQMVRVHPRSACEGRGIPCCIHSPSDHHMTAWPQNWRGDTQVMERTCPHHIGHPDPDHMAYIRSLTPEHSCIDELLETHEEYGESIEGWDRFTKLCKYLHLEWQGVHSCDGCCVKPE